MSLKKIMLLLLLAIWHCVPARVQTDGEVKLPDTPAARRVGAFIKAFNSGDDATMRAFHADNAAASVLAENQVDELAEMDRRIFSETGGFVLRRVIESNNSNITVLLEAKKGSWFNFRCEVESAPPHKIIGLGLEPVEAPSDSSPGGSNSSTSATRKMNDEEIAAALTTYMDEAVKADRFSGVVLVAKNGKPIFAKAYGLADKSKNVPNKIDTKFNLGSMNKMFTAVAIAQLAERGKLSFTDTVGKHLPNYPNKAVADKVTIHHLLTHTSGLGSYWNDKFQARRANIKTVADYLSLFADDPLSFEPGARFQYSNSGYIVLGAIIEKVSGQSYYDYVKEHVYKPAGMTNTDAYEMNQDVPNLAMGYTSGGENSAVAGARRPNNDSRPNKGGPAGGGYSTAEDLLKFAIALRDNKLLSAKSTETVTTGKVQTGMGQYGYGFGSGVVNGKLVFGHNGGAPGIAADLSIFPELGYTAVVMSNYDPPAVMPVVRKIREMLTRD